MTSVDVAACFGGRSFPGTEAEPSAGVLGPPVGAGRGFATGVRSRSELARRAGGQGQVMNWDRAAFIQLTRLQNWGMPPVGKRRILQFVISNPGVTGSADH